MQYSDYLAFASKTCLSFEVSLSCRSTTNCERKLTCLLRSEASTGVSSTDSISPLLINLMISDLYCDCQMHPLIQKMWYINVKIMLKLFCYNIYWDRYCTLSSSLWRHNQVDVRIFSIDLPLHVLMTYPPATHPKNDLFISNRDMNAKHQYWIWSQ